MRTWAIISIIFCVGYASAHIPHIPLDLTFEETRALQARLPDSQIKNINNNSIKAAIKGGERLSQWIDLINAQRTDENAIRLTSKATQRGIPVESPSKYGPSTIEKKLNDLINDMPSSMTQIIYRDDVMTETISVEDAQFIEWGRKVSRLYQSAVRWETFKPWRRQMAERRFRDIRGFYHLRKIENLDQLLSDFSQQTQDMKNELRSHLEMICLNSTRNEKTCSAEFQLAEGRNQIKEFKDRFWRNSQRIWDSFFKISNPRRDVTWTNPQLMEVKFKDPKNTKIATWLKENVEDEFQWAPENWQLQMNFVERGFGLSHLEFKKNTTPHVSGGNKIVMDANTPLEEYNVRWTIRHEYGHILRLPDCYHEFFLPEENLMMSYQLDITDLMCSRVGEMNDRIFQELKKVYFK